MMPAVAAYDPTTACAPSAHTLASWTHKTVWPTEMDQVLTARVVRRESPFQLENIAWIVFHHTRILYVVAGGVN